MIGATEIIIILVAVLVILFGAKKIGEVGRSLGKFTTEYKKGKIEAEKELQQFKEESDKPQQ